MVNGKKRFHSKLSELIDASTRNAGRKNANTVPLTIYLPSGSSMTVYVSETSCFGDLIQQILKTHKEDGLRPKLYYSSHDCYDLRMHEGTAIKITDYVLTNQMFKSSSSFYFCVGLSATCILHKLTISRSIVHLFFPLYQVTGSPIWISPQSTVR